MELGREPIRNRFAEYALQRLQSMRYSACDHCGTVMPHNELPRHMTERCPEAQASCTFPGCLARMKRRDLAAHQASAAQVHLELAIKLAERLRQQEDDADKEKQMLHQQLSEEEQLHQKTRKEAAQEGDSQKSLVEHMAYAMQLLKDNEQFVDKMLKSKYSSELAAELERSDCFYMKTPGTLDRGVLKKCGMPLKMAVFGEDNRGNLVNHEVDQWVTNWECRIFGSDMEQHGHTNLQGSYPNFDKDHAFRKFEGKFTTVREEDETIPGQTFSMNGRTLKAPDIEYSALFVKEIRRRFGRKADSILRHLMNACNLFEVSGGSVSGYSMPKILWDSHRDAPMKPEDKTKLLMKYVRKQSQDDVDKEKQMKQMLQNQLQKKQSELQRLRDLLALREDEIEFIAAQVQMQAASVNTLQEATTELTEWRSGARRFIPNVIDVEAGSVSSMELLLPQRTTGLKRPLAAGESSIGTIVKIKKEKLDVEEDRDDYESNLQLQTLFTDFLQTKIDTLKECALAAGANTADVMSCVQQEWRSHERKF